MNVCPLITLKYIFHIILTIPALYKKLIGGKYYTPQFNLKPMNPLILSIILKRG